MFAHRNAQETLIYLDKHNPTLAFSGFHGKKQIPGKHDTGVRKHHVIGATLKFFGELKIRLRHFH